MAAQPTPGEPRSRTSGDVRGLEGSGITFVSGVADSVFAELIAGLERDELGGRFLLATREDNAVALAFGTYLAGERPLVFMESAGFGTSLDAITSLAMTYGAPIVILMAWAGYRGRDVPHHNAIGEPLEEILRALDLPLLVCKQHDLGAPSFPELLAKARRLAETASLPSVILVVPTELDKDEGQ